MRRTDQALHDRGWWDCVVEDLEKAVDYPQIFEPATGATGRSGIHQNSDPISAGILANPATALDFWVLIRLLNLQRPRIFNKIHYQKSCKRLARLELLFQFLSQQIPRLAKLGGVRLQLDGAL